MPDSAANVQQQERYKNDSHHMVQIQRSFPNSRNIPSPPRQRHSKELDAVLAKLGHHISCGYMRQKNDHQTSVGRLGDHTIPSRQYGG